MTWFMRGNKWLGGPDTRQIIRESIQMIQRSEIKKIYAAVHTFRKQNLKPGRYPVMLIMANTIRPSFITILFI